MVCVGTGFAYHFHSLIHGKSFFFGQQTDQFRDHHGRISVVDLDHCMLVQFMQIVSCVLHLL